jgi:hypothetical protein
LFLIYKVTYANGIDRIESEDCARQGMASRANSVWCQCSEPIQTEYMAFGCFQATGTPMAKILRLSAQCALRETTILQLKKLKKIVHCKDLGIKKPSFKIVSKLF